MSAWPFLTLKQTTSTYLEMAAWGTPRSPVPPIAEKWGFYCVGFTGLWTLGASGWLLYYYLHHLSAIPTQGSSSIEAYKAALEANKLATDQLKESINFLFESMVTKTMIPIVTLLLGYLFGSSSKKE